MGFVRKVLVNLATIHWKLDMINTKMTREFKRMGAREDAAYARQGELIQAVKDGSTAKDAEIAALRAELENADASALERVNSALEADSEFDAEKVEAGNKALEELVAAPSPADGAGDVVDPATEPAPVSDQVGDPANPNEPGLDPVTDEEDTTR